MPPAAPRPCAHPNCGALVTRGRCPRHERQRQAEDVAYRGTSTDRGYDGKWRALRDWYAATHEHCATATCGVWLPYSERLIDHIAPHRGDDALRLAPSNLQVLCRVCHARKTHAEGAGHRAPRGNP